MSHHFVTVCVVCVLCAAHTPCSAHTDFTATTEQMSYDTANREDLSNTKEQVLVFGTISMRSKLKGPFKTNVDNVDGEGGKASKFREKLEFNDSKRLSIKEALISTDTSYSKFSEMKVSSKKPSTKVEQLEEVTDTGINKNLEVLKRLGQIELISQTEQEIGHFDSGRNRISKLRRRRTVDIDERYFMRKIFEAYGDGTSVTMEGFEKLLRKLGLLRLLSDISKLEEHNVNADRPKKRLDNSKVVSNNGLQGSEGGSIKERCLSSKELLNSMAQGIPYRFDTNSSSTQMPSWLFERVCPALVYQLAGESSAERNGCIKVPESYKSAVIHDEYRSDEVTRNMVQVWVYSTISILVISLCGLLGVAVIPVMGKIYYHQLLQFLVALAVGTLCGDALIHLLPHAMMSPEIHGHNFDGDHTEEGNSSTTSHEEQHNLNMWKGLVAMIGLVSFFLTEKALTMLAEWRKYRQRRNKLPSRVRIMRESEGPNSNMVGEKLCKHKYSSYPYCYGEITTNTEDNHHKQQRNHHERPSVIEEEKPLTGNCNPISKTTNSDVEKKEKDNDDWKIDDSVANNATKNNADSVETPLNESESYTVIIREHETKHHGHTHSHGHVHSAPESMSSVAWMVVMGDGLHNFTDGMAIGAAFAANIAGGFSTAIAVFCHELPHELGDFAVLLKAGMSAKQAVFYNLLSSVLCLFGMIVGVLLGSTPAATSWIFAVAAGMFIYIALVDMIPELSTGHSTEQGSHWQCLLQTSGLSLGLAIMLVIALYEHDLKHIFSD